MDAACGHTATAVDISLSLRHSFIVFPHLHYLTCLSQAGKTLRETIETLFESI